MYFYWDNIGVSKGLHGNKLFQINAYEENGIIKPYLCREHETYVLRFSKELTDEQFFLT